MYFVELWNILNIVKITVQIENCLILLINKKKSNSLDWMLDTRTVGILKRNFSFFQLFVEMYKENPKNLQKMINFYMEVGFY